ncbi:MAG: hypothetical protein J0M12_03325 [Deltaproteobacteria bacterium]|nr:hypothetical protein [Deltaproteobacteria bacterium]
MFRIMFSIFFWALVGRWAYSEVNLVFPSVTPVIDFALTKLQIPTHDRWDPAAINSFIASARSFGEEAMKASKTSAAHGNNRAQSFVRVTVDESKSISKSLRQNDGLTRF